MSNPTSSLPPGFRFHPTDEELILHYLRNRAAASPCPVSIIAEVDIYKLDPWDLPAKALFGDREWYFFSPRDRKYPNGVRPNRAAASGYWKATGTDKPILASAAKETIGVKKALVFYKGKPPKGTKTNWIMHEYRLSGNPYAKSVRPMRLGDSSMRLDDWVLCRIYQKSGQSCPMDHGEDSAGDDTQLPSPTETTQQSILTLPKSFSLSELFEEADYSLMTRILDNPTEIPELDRGPAAYNQNLNQPFINHSNVNVYLTSPFPETEPSVSIPEFYMKRQREEGGAVVNPSKRHHGALAHPSFGSQFDSGLSFFNQQLLLNSQLGLH